MKAENKPGLAGTSTPDTDQINDTGNDNPITCHCKCPTCGHALPYTSWYWLDELSMLLARHAGQLGISPELAGFTLLELWYHYLWLRGL